MNKIMCHVHYSHFTLNSGGMRKYSYLNFVTKCSFQNQLLYQFQGQNHIKISIKLDKMHITTSLKTKFFNAHHLVVLSAKWELNASKINNIMRICM